MAGKRLSPEAKMGRNLYLLRGELIGVSNIALDERWFRIHNWAQKIIEEIDNKFGSFLEADTTWTKSIAKDKK
jgi:hypothetical protein